MIVERHHSALIVASAITVASFVGATAYTQAHLAQLDVLSANLETNAIPSIEYMSRTAVRLTRLNDLLDEMTAAGAQRTTAAQTARNEVDAVSADVDRYLALPPLPGEQPLWDNLRTDIGQALPLVRATVNEASALAFAVPADRSKTERTHDALDDALGAVLATMDFDVRRSQTMARDIRIVRVRTLRAITGLDAIATAIAAIGLFVAYRASSRHDQLVRVHDALMTERMTELDRFAGRMAHDVLSPLGTVAMALGLLEPGCDERGKHYVARSREAVQRVRELVEGLLRFARAGARPDPTASCSLDAVFTRLVADCSEPAENAGITLTIAPPPHVELPCAVGVITSVLENLVRNAIKYMGSGSVRRVTVHAIVRDAMARIEVADTGPGVAPELQGRIFEPFVRGPETGTEGAGLGLATVKRLVERHGGKVGVDSRPGEGSLFWVELPVRTLQ
ncbi:MAG TPA: HAMP domain-containing sensor histidine kinase [Vicinamibacterales bacterium]|jgi:signal transduction histidine kinase|nr:HAMP domain-containing sensor histidine kinase [Vicinamibacterales bacterium]